MMAHTASLHACTRCSSTPHSVFLNTRSLDIYRWYMFAVHQNLFHILTKFKFCSNLPSWTLHFQKYNVLMLEHICCSTTRESMAYRYSIISRTSKMEVSVPERWRWMSLLCSLSPPSQQPPSRPLMHRRMCYPQLLQHGRQPFVQQTMIQMTHS